MTPIRLLFPAEMEMRNAAIYYETQVAGLGVVFLTKIEAALRDIASNPEVWPIIKNGIHKRRVYRFPYSLIYRIDANSVVILAVMHQHRRPDYWLDHYPR